MSKYIIHFTGEKRVDDWDPQQGAAGNWRIIDNWTTSIASDAKPTLAQLNSFIYDRYGIGANKFRYWPDDPGRFSADRLEDKNGNENKRGKYLADYNIYINCTPTQDPLPVGHLGLKHIA